MYQIHYLNSISPKGKALWTEEYKETEAVADAQAILVRSAAMHDMELSENRVSIISRCRNVPRPVWWCSTPPVPTL